MAGVKGIKNGRGAKGRSGRKSAFQEQADAQWLSANFFGKVKLQELKAKIESGNFSLAERLVFLAADDKNLKPLLAIFAKLFPDVVKGDLTKKILILDIDEE